MEIPTLETPRLRLRGLTLPDFDWYADLCADEEVMKFLAGTQSRFQAWRTFCSILGHWELRGFGFFGVEEKSSGRLVGRVGHLLHEGWPDFEIGWTLARDAWGKGYATEAAECARDYAFEVLARPRVISMIDPNNAASAQVAARIGERKSGKARVFDFPEVDVWTLERPDWETLKRSEQSESNA